MRVEFRDIPGVTKLYGDFFYKPGSLSGWLGGDFRDLGSYRRIAERLRSGDSQRDRLADLLHRQNRLYGSSPDAAESIEKIRNGALCVVTGHQICFMSGPLLVLYKAITVSKLAAKLSESLDIPVVPVFWMATDDHDFEEINHVFLPDQAGKLAKVAYGSSDVSSDRPVADLVLGGEIGQFADAVLGVLPADAPGSTDVLAIAALYREGERASVAFARTLRLLCADKSLVIFDPSAPEARELAAPIFRQEIVRHDDTRDAILSANESLAQSGYHNQVVRDPDSLNLFYVDGLRRRLRVADNRIDIEGSDRRCAPEYLASEADSDPSRFSPNVLLRAVVQSRILPTLSYVGGPAEVAYFAQAGGLFDLFGVTRPVVFPRLSATLIEPWCRRLIEKHGIDLARLASVNSRESYLTEILRAQFPDPAGSALHDSREKITSELETIGSAIAQDKDLLRTLEQTRKRVDFELRSFQDKVFKSHRKANDDFIRKYRQMAEWLFPEQTLQERHFSVLYFLNKYGTSALDRIRTGLDIDQAEHRLIGL